MLHNVFKDVRYVCGNTKQQQCTLIYLFFEVLLFPHYCTYVHGQNVSPRRVDVSLSVIKE
jgi:hypothetical protein